MTHDEDAHRAAFEQRLRVLGLDELEPAERKRIWQSHLTQLRLSARFDAEVPPALEPALSFRAGARP
jgi:hypothetical protein